MDLVGEISLQRGGARAGKLWSLVLEPQEASEKACGTLLKRGYVSIPTCALVKLSEAFFVKEGLKMSLYVLTYDVRAKNHDYARLYALLDKWNAKHLQDSVWLADLNGEPPVIRDTMIANMHPDDTACVIPIATGRGWATRNAKQGAADWLRGHLSISA